MDWDDNFYTDHRVKQLQDTMRRRGRMASRARARDRDSVSELEGEIDFLTLVNRTLVSLIVEKGMATPEELAKRMIAIDASDGEMDGRAKPDDLAKDMGLEEMPEQPKPPPKAPKSNRRRR